MIQIVIPYDHYDYPMVKLSLSLSHIIIIIILLFISSHFYPTKKNAN